jgi:hypothetical protein
MKLQLQSTTSFLLALSLGGPHVKGLPSFGSKVPNGQRVPCPPSSPGCSESDVCFGLGHLSCGGFQPEDKTIDATTGAASIALNPFGEDWRANGFVWTKELCELDSDGDGYTNGEELGDPNCLWDTNTIAPELNSVEGFVPSHPGNKDSAPTIPETVTTVAADTTADTTPGTADDPYAAYYNPGETRGSFDLIMKPYPIPIETTTYVDFLFEVPEDLPDLVHVVFGEVINTQPDHLHHFVLNGCTEPIDKEQEGLPRPDTPLDCTTQIGLWAPGADVFPLPDPTSALVFGRGTGIVALALNVHYTDGVYEDADTKAFTMAEDGIRVHYTTDFRPNSTVRKELIWVPIGPPQLTVPPKKSRFFLSRTCNVRTSCKDASEFHLASAAEMFGLEVPPALTAGGPLTCASISTFCLLGGDLGAAIQKLCPATCGLCDDATPEGKLRNPESYRVSAIFYHAHLLGSEMYATLLRPKEVQEDASMIEKRSSIEAAMEAKDLQSREYYFVDDQAVIPMDYDIVATGGSNNTEREMMRGVQIQEGDKIQVTCVYDSTDKTDPTIFGLSTYDEMCVISVEITIETPNSILSGETTNVDIGTDMDLRLFTCEVDNEDHSSDVYQGFLNSTEDGRNIWFEHPIENTDMCTFPIGDYFFSDVLMTQEVRNCETSVAGRGVCDGLEEDKVEFMELALAGHSCEGGKPGFMDSNENPELDEETCLAEGGGLAYFAYTCADIQAWLLSGEASALDTYDITTLWQPQCCRLIAESGGGEGEAPAGMAMEEDDEEATLESGDSEDVASGASSVYGMVSLLVAVMVAFIL